LLVIFSGAIKLREAERKRARGGASKVPYGLFKDSLDEVFVLIDQMNAEKQPPVASE
jgi:hypothetical protein